MAILDGETAPPPYWLCPSACQVPGCLDPFLEGGPCVDGRTFCMVQDSGIGAACSETTNFCTWVYAELWHRGCTATLPLDKPPFGGKHSFEHGC